MINPAERFQWKSKKISELIEIFKDPGFKPSLFDFDSLPDTAIASIIRSDPVLFEKLPVKIKNTVAAQRELVKSSLKGIRRIKKPSDDLLQYALDRWGPPVIQIIHERHMTDELYMQAILMNPMTIIHISDSRKTRKMCDLAVEMDPFYRHYIPSRLVVAKDVTEDPRLHHKLSPDKWSQEAADAAFKYDTDIIRQIPCEYVTLNMMIESVNKNSTCLLTGVPLNILLETFYAIAQMPMDKSGNGANRIKETIEETRSKTEAQLAGFIAKNSTPGYRVTAKKSLDGNFLVFSHNFSSNLLACLYLCDARDPIKFAEFVNNKPVLCDLYREIHGTAESLKNLKNPPLRDWAMDDLSL